MRCPCDRMSTVHVGIPTSYTYHVSIARLHAARHNTTQHDYTYGPCDVHPMSIPCIPCALYLCIQYLASCVVCGGFELVRLSRTLRALCFLALRDWLDCEKLVVIACDVVEIIMISRRMISFKKWSLV